MNCQHCCTRRLPQLLPAYIWLCNHCGAYVDKAGNPITVTQTQADAIGTVPLANPGPDCATRRTTAAHDRAAAEPAIIARARALAADYQTNPTPARAHNAAQTLQRVLDALDAVVARTSRIAALASQLDMPPLAELPDNAANHWTAVADTQAGQLCDFAEGAGIGFTDADKPTTEQLDALIAKHLTPPKLCPGLPVAEPHFARLACFLPEGHSGDHDNQPPTGPGFPIVTAPVEWCGADGWHGSSNTLTCFLARGHEGDHSTNAHPNPRTWPKLATGGIVDPNRATRIGEGS